MALALAGVLAALVLTALLFGFPASWKTRRSGPGASNPVNPAAYEAYVRGRRYWNTRTPAGLRTAIEYFNQALEKDPRYAPAYSGIADCYTLLGLAGGSGTSADFGPKAKAAALHALAIDDSLAEAHTSLAGIKAFYDWDWPGAGREFKRALELNPNYALAHHWYGIVYFAALGKQDETMAQMRRAHDLDAESPIINTDLGWALYLARRYDEAIAQYRRVLAQAPNFEVARFRLGQVYLLKGMYPDFVESLEASDATRHRQAESVPWTVPAHPEILRAQLEGFIKLSSTMRVPPYHFAEQYARLGDKDQAIAWLEKAYSERYPALIYIEADPQFDGLRSNPRFRELARRIGLHVHQ